MSAKTIDEKVVEMRFDNQQFEKNVKTSLSTLDKLKKSLRLDGESKSFQKLEQAAGSCRLTGLAGAVDTVAAKFSALDVVAITAISNITTSAMRAGSELVKSLSVDQVTAGWNKYAQKTASVQTIMNATGKSIDEVNGYLDKLMWFSDETSYGFTDMTQALGQLTSAGGNIEKLIPMITGIANATAFAGKGAMEFSRSIYNLNQSYTAGSLQYMDWKSLELAGVASKQLKETFIETAEAMGKIQKGQITLANFNETLKDKWADTAVMEAAFGKFGEMTEKAYEMVQSGEVETASEAYDLLAKKYDGVSIKAAKAAQEAKTFTEAIDATKDAVSSGWMKSFELVFGNYEEAKVLWTDMANSLWDIFASGGESRNEMLSEALSPGTSGLNALEEVLEGTGIELDDFKQRLVEVGKEHGKLTDEMIEEAGSLEAALSGEWLDGSVISETLLSFVDGFLGAADAANGMTQSMEELEDVASRVMRGEFFNGADRVKALTEAGYDYAAVQSLVNHKLLGTEFKINELSDAQLKNVGYTQEQIAAIRELAKQAEETGTPINELLEKLNRPSGRQLFGDSIRNILNALSSLSTAARDAWESIFPQKRQAEGIYRAIAAFHDLTKALVPSEEQAEKLTRSFKGLFAVIDIITTVTGGAAKLALKTFTTLLGMANVDILDFTANAGDAAVALRDWLNENVFVRGVQGAVNAIIALIDMAKKLGGAFLNIPQVARTVSAAKDAFVALKEAAGELLKGGSERLSAFLERVNALDGITLENLGAVLRDFSDNVLSWFLTLGGRFDSFGDLLDMLREKIAGFFAGGWSMLTQLPIFIQDKIGEAIGNVQLGFRQGAEAAEGLKDSVWASLSGIPGMLGVLAEKIFGFASGLRAKFDEKIGLNNLLAVGAGVSIILVANKIGEALQTLSRPLKTLFDIGDGVGKVIDGFGRVLQSVSKKIKAETLAKKAESIRTLAVSVAILAGSVALLTTLDQEKAWGAIGMMGVLAAGAAALSAAMGAVSKAGGGKLSLSATGLAAGILMLVVALKKMEELSQYQLMGNLGVLALMGTGLTVLAAALSRAAPQLSGGSIFLVSFALSMLTLLRVVEKLQGMGNSPIGAGAIGALAVMIGGLALVGKACSGLQLGSGAGVLAVAMSLKVLVGVIQSISALDMNAVGNNLDAFIGIFTMLTRMVAASRFAGGNSWKAGAGVLAVCAGLLLLVPAIKGLGGIECGALDRAADTISKLILVFSVVTAASALAGKNAAKAGAMLLMMSGALVVLTGVIFMLSNLEPDGVDRALETIIKLEAVFGALIVVSHFAGEANKTILSLTVAVGLLSVALGALSFIEPERLAGTAQALSLVIAAFGAAVAATAVAKNALPTMISLTVAVGALAAIMGILNVLDADASLENAASLSLLLISLSGAMVIAGKAEKISASALGAMAEMSLVVGGLAAVLGLMAGLNVSASMENSAALSLLLVSLSGAMTIAGKAGDISVSALTSLGVMTLVTAALGLILGLMASFDVAPSLDTAAALSLLLLSLSGACVILNGVGKTGASAFVGIGALMTLIAAVGGLMIGIGALADYFPALESFLDTGMVLLQKIGEGLGGFFGGVIGGFLTGATDGLGDVGTNLSNFMENAKPFFDGLEGVDPTSMSSIQMLADALASLSGANLTEGIVSFFTGKSSLSDFGKELESFGGYFTSYANQMSEIANLDVVAQSADAAKSLAAFASTIPNQGGVLADLMGDNTLSNFGKELESFGGYFASYANQMSGISGFDVVAQSADAARSLAAFATNIPNQGGVLADLMGDNTLSKFGKSLEKFGESYVAYYNSLSAISDMNKVTEATDGMAALIELAQVSLADAKISSFLQFLKELGKTSLNDFLQSFVKGKKDAKSAGEEISAKLKEGLEKPDYKKIGKNAAEGFINGIKCKCGDSQKAGAALGSAALDGACKALDEHSPSRKFRQVGEYAAEGMTIGIQNGTPEAVSAAAGMGEASARETFHVIEQFMSGKTITLPGVDGSKTLSDIQNLAEQGKNALQGTMDTGKQWLAGQLTDNTPSIEIPVDVSMDSLDTSGLSGISNTLDTLGSQLDASASNLVSAADGMEQAADSLFHSVSSWDAKFSGTRGELQKLTQWTAEELSAGTLTDEKELAAMEDLLATTFKETTAEREKQDMEAWRRWADMQPAFNALTSGEINIFKDGKVLEDLRGVLYEVNRLGTYQFNMDELKYIIDNLGNPSAFMPAATIDAYGYEGYKSYEEDRNVLLEGRDAALERIAAKEEQAFQDRLKYIEQTKNAGELSTTQAIRREIEMYEELLEKYKDNAERRAEIEETLSQKRIDLKRAEYEHSMDWIEEEQYYGRMALADELAAYTRVQQRYAKGAEERKKMDREIYRVQKEMYEAKEKYIEDVRKIQEQANDDRLKADEEYAEKVKQINENLAKDIESAENKYQNSLESRAKSLYNTYGLFDEVKAREEVSGAELTANLEDQVKEFGAWQDILDSLSARGLDEELIDELRQMGPSAIGQIQALNSMSDKELEKYVSLWSIKHAQARSQAVGELAGMRQETTDEINKLREEANEQLQQCEADWMSKVAQITAEADAEVERLSKELAKKLGLMKENTDKTLTEMAENAQKILKEAGWDETGKMAVTGLIRGMEAELPNYIQTVRDITLAGVQAARETLDEHSPSRVYTQIGRFAGQGLVNGLAAYTSNVYDAGADMAWAARDGAFNALKLVSSLINDGMDTEPVITPVLDLSDIQRGAQELDGLLSPVETTALAGQAGWSMEYRNTGERVNAGPGSGDVVKELRALRADMAEMAQRMNRLQVVMDTGRLVGELAEPMDSALGQRYAQKERGV